jgi:hypothetical protein
MARPRPHSSGVMKIGIDVFVVFLLFQRQFIQGVTEEPD